MVFQRLRQAFTCKFLCLTLALALSCFLLEEYLTFGMWDAADYRTLAVCSEEYYVFAPGQHPGSLLADRALMARCDALTNHNTTRSRPNLTSCSSDSSLERAPDVITKCGTVQPVLISHRVASRPVLCDDGMVPNVVHYISLGSWRFSFLNYLSFRSVDLVQKPSYVFVHGDGLPYGPWWDRTLSEVANVYYVRRKRPKRIQGRKIRWLEHATDVMRLQTIWDNGGIYLDTDILLLKSFDPLRRYEMTLGRETSYGLGSGVIVARRHAPFLCVWFNVFRDYNPFPWNWAYYVVLTPERLARVLPDNRLHVEENSLHKPSWQQAELLFQKRVDWSKNYAVHVWKRYGRVPEGPDEIDGLNTTLGDIMRYIYYGIPKRL